MNQNRQHLLDLNQTIQDHIRQTRQPTFSRTRSLENLSPGVVPTIPSFHTMSLSKPPKLTKKKANTKTTTSTERKENESSSSTNMDNQSEKQIVNIWASNLSEAMSKIEDIIEKYPYIALVCITFVALCARIDEY